MPPADPKKLASPSRLAALRASGMLDASPDQALDRLTQAASRAVGAPIAIVNLIDDRRQFFASQVGVGEPWASARGNSMAYSFCQHVVASGKPLIITDAPRNPLVADNPAIPEMGVMAYAGMPLTNADGETLGTFCAVDTRPREWSAAELDVLEVLADAAMREMELRAAVVELDRLNRFKSQIVGFAGHELRSPLAGIIGALEVIDMDLPPDHDREMVTLAMESGRRLLRMVNELLDVDALDRGTIPIQLKVQDLDPLVRTACEGARPVAASQGIEIQSAASGLRVRADADRIVQVLANLIGNALKFSPRGSRISIDAERAGPEVRVAVRDHGRGVPDAHKESIFEQFVQVERADKYEKGGAGLGLAICRAIVGHHGGTIWVEDTPGGGSTFCFTLPTAE